MRALSASELLGVWERGLAQQPIQRALTLLSAAFPQTSPDVLAKLSIGQRDACLLTLREWLFGSQLVSLAMCPHCGERLELTFNVADIRVPSKAEPVSDTELRSNIVVETDTGTRGRGDAEQMNVLRMNATAYETFSLSVADYEVHFRLPNSLDLAAITSREGVAATRQMLLDRCLVTAHHNGEETFAHQLPAEIVNAIAQQMTQADPQADVHLDLTCPACNYQWQAPFDIVSFFWSEINTWAQRILGEVHTLAKAYGWSEADILALTPWRRQFYLEMVS